MHINFARCFIIIVISLWTLNLQAMWPAAKESDMDRWLELNKASQLDYQQLKRSVYFIIVGAEVDGQKIYLGHGSAFTVGSLGKGFSNYHVFRNCIMDLDRRIQKRGLRKNKLRLEKSESIINQPELCESYISIRADRLSEAFKEDYQTLVAAAQLSARSVLREAIDLSDPIQWFVNDMGLNPNYINPNGVKDKSKNYEELLWMLNKHNVETTPVYLVSNYSEALSDRVNYNILSSTKVNFESLKYDVVQIHFDKAKPAVSALSIDPGVLASEEWDNEEILFSAGFPATVYISKAEAVPDDLGFPLMNFCLACFSLSSGYITGGDFNGLLQSVSPDLKETWLPTNVGSSGGPLFDREGRIRGINVGIGSGLISLGSVFVPLSHVLEMYPSLEEGSQ